MRGGREEGDNTTEYKIQPNSVRVIAITIDNNITKENSMSELKEHEKIIVIAGNREQFKYWVNYNIVPVTNVSDVHKLRGIRLHKIYVEGTWYEWMNDETNDMIRVLNRGEWE